MEDLPQKAIRITQTIHKKETLQWRERLTFKNQVRSNFSGYV